MDNVDTHVMDQWCGHPFTQWRMESVGKCGHALCREYLIYVPGFSSFGSRWTDDTDDKEALTWPLDKTTGQESEQQGMHGQGED